MAAMRHTSAWMRLAAALACSVLLHLGLLAVFRLSQSTQEASHRSFAVLLAPRENTATREKTPETSEKSRSRDLVAARSTTARPVAAPDTPHIVAPPDASMGGRASVSAGPISAPASAPASKLPDAAGYLDDTRLSAAPQISGQFVAAYPPEAIGQRRRGTVIVQLMIDTDGTVAEALAVPGAPDDLTEAALAAIRRTRFTPAQAGKAPARARVYFTVSFVIE